MNEEFRSRQSELVDKVLQIVSSYHPVLGRVSEVIQKLDVLASFAEVSAMYRYVMPKLSCTEEQMDGQKLVLCDSRHPLIEVQDPARCIPNDCTMVRGESNL